MLSRTASSSAASAFGTLELLKVITRYRSVLDFALHVELAGELRRIGDGDLDEDHVVGVVRSLSRLTWRSLSL